MCEYGCIMVEKLIQNEEENSNWNNDRPEIINNKPHRLNNINVFKI